MRLLVTGGAGFIGANFCHHLARTTDHTITVVDKLTYAGNRGNLNGIDAQRLTFVEADVTDAPTVTRLAEASDAIVHFAAESHNDNSLREPRPFVDSNLLGTFTLLEAARRTG
ncbi:MAG: GDP-mannose 4,6-dehydratase, partial [Micrococcales bacterium]|nr:GDP-mannose 4,6-dehydratase [Micrococcales bacterium]